MTLRTYAQRAMLSRPARTLLTIASIVIGVAAVVSITIVTATTRESYKNLFTAVRGKAALEVGAANSASVPASLTDAVAKVDGVKAAVPLVKQLTAMTLGEQRIRLQVLGIDPDRDKVVRELQVVDGRLLTSADTDHVMLEADFANQIGVKAGDVIKLLTKKRLRNEDIGPRDMTVVGIVKLVGGTLMQTGFVFMPLENSQRRFVGRNRIDMVQVVVDEDADVEAVQAAIQKTLPEGIEARPPGGGAQGLQDTLKSTEQGLRLATCFSLLLAGFIILNTFLMNVGERRRQLAILRVIGATRRQIAMSMIGEALVLATIGTIVGIGAGLGTAALLTSTLAKAFDISLPSAFTFMNSPMLYGLAVLFGFVISLLGAVMPALRAGAVSPLEGMSAISATDLTGVPRRYIVFGFVLTVISSVIVALSIAGYMAIEISTFAAVGILAGVVMIMPLLLGPFTRGAAMLFSTIYRIETTLALKQVLRHQGRSALTVGVLAIAASTGVGIAYSIMDNVGDVQDWYQRSIIGDYYVRAMLPDISSGLSADLPEELDADLRALKGIRQLDRAKLVELPVKRAGAVAGPDGAEPEEISALAFVREFTAAGKLPLDLIEGDEKKLREQLTSGQVVVGNILAHRLELHVGDEIDAGTQNGRKQLRVCGIANEYLVGGQTVYMEWNFGTKLLGVEGVDGYMIRAEKAELLALKPKLEAITKKYGVLLHSAAEIRSRIDKIIIGVDGCLWGLVFLGFIVAAFGVVNTLSMNVLEQTRELGLLRIVAMTKAQVRRTITAQALLIGAAGLIPGVLSGIGVAYIMNLSMEPSFGRPIEFGWHPWLIVFSLVGSLFITWLAAVIPAERAARVNVVEALHYE